MAIRDIFKMIKADRYTQDGREELIKAQEAVTEDVTYKPGDISRKTGLQKQPDGSWAPVKNAPAQKKGLGGKTLTKGAKHYPTVGEYAENGPIEQRMAMQKLLEKNGPVEKTKQSASGDPQNVYGAKVDEIYERQLKRIKELKAKGYTDEQIDSDKIIKQTKEDMKNVGKESASGSGLSERAQYSVSQTAAGMSTEALKSHVDKLKNDPVTRNSISNPDAMAKAYEAELAKRKGSASGSTPSADWEKDIPNASNEELENIVKLEEKLPRMSEQSRSEFSPKIEKAKAELAKRGETVTKMSDLVAQKSRPESAPTGRQPTPEMLEREKMRQAPEAKARRDKLDAEHPRTETGAPKFETEQENAQYARGLEGWDDVNPDRLPDIKKKVEQKIDYYKKYDPYAMLGKKTGLTAAQKSAVQQNMAQAKENLAFYTGQLEGINKKMGGGSNDSAPRILTGDCKVRIKKSK